MTSKKEATEKVGAFLAIDAVSVVGFVVYRLGVRAANRERRNRSLRVLVKLLRLEEAQRAFHKLDSDFPEPPPCRSILLSGATVREIITGGARQWS
jgi:hypothetical protein